MLMLANVGSWHRIKARALSCCCCCQMVTGKYGSTDWGVCLQQQGLLRAMQTTMIWSWWWPISGNNETRCAISTSLTSQRVA